MKKMIHVSNQGATLDTSRRNFLKLSGIGLAIAGLAIIGCDDDNDFYPMDNNQIFFF